MTYYAGDNPPKRSSSMMQFSDKSAPDLTFTWDGGPYIDVINTHTHDTIDCINVWDYANDRPRIQVDYQDFALECEGWVLEAIEDTRDDS